LKGVPPRGMASAPLGPQPTRKLRRNS
jgi:hypothetical protein